MKFDEFVAKYSQNPLILSSLFAGEDDPSYIRRQVTSWKKRGLLIQLKRGVYLINREPFKSQSSLAYLANQLYFPSYISLETALAHYGMIPEGVFAITSISTKKTKIFDSPLGCFRFYSISPRLFFGFEEHSFGKQKVLMASKEKALLDFLYLNSGRFSEPEEVKESMRFEGINRLKSATLNKYLNIFNNQKLSYLTKGLAESD